MLSKKEIDIFFKDLDNKKIGSKFVRKTLKTNENKEIIKKFKLWTYIYMGFFVFIGVILMILGAINSIKVQIGSAHWALLGSGLFSSFVLSFIGASIITNFKINWLRKVIYKEINKETKIKLIYESLNQVPNVQWYLNDFNLDENNYLTIRFKENKTVYTVISSKENSIYLKDNVEIKRLNDNSDFNFDLIIKTMMVDSFKMKSEEAVEEIIDYQIFDATKNIIINLKNNLEI